MVDGRQQGGRDRSLAERQGRRAELFAALFLWLKGYRLLERRFRTGVGEIDLIVSKGDRLAFVEVKRRERAGDALDAVTPRQQQRVRRAAEVWLARRRGGPAPARIGFDVVVVAPRRLPVHLVDAFSHMPYEAGSGSNGKGR